MADAVQAFWQDVHQEPPDELVSLEGDAVLMAFIILLSSTLLLPI